MIDKSQKIIAFAGQLANGKSIAGERLIKYLNSGVFYSSNKQNESRYTTWREAAFGKSLKLLFQQYFNINTKILEEYKRIPDFPPKFASNIRTSLQGIGDECRKHYPTIWIDRLFDDSTNQNCNLIITDARYRNEIEEIKKRKGKSVLIYRPDKENDIDHPSESQYKEFINILKNQKEGPINDKDIPFDWYMINDGTVEELYNKIIDDLVPYFKDYLTSK